MRFAWPILFVIASASCLRKTEFHCETAGDCGGTGACTGGFCAFPDQSCSGGYRYDDSAGASSNQCIGGSTGIDAGLDAPPDTAVDTPSVGCPSGYDPLPGGSPHVYKLITTTDMWLNQRSTCHATSPSAYLAIPDDLTELTALNTLAAAPAWWAGINDMTTEGQYVNDKGVAQTFFKWAAGQPDNNGPGEEDCVAGVTAMNAEDDQKCNIKLRTICECEP